MRDIDVQNLDSPTFRDEEPQRKDASANALDKSKSSKYESFV